MEFLKWDELEICDDCVVFIANGDMPTTDDTGDEYYDETGEPSTDNYELRFFANIPASHRVIAFCCDYESEEYGCQTHFSWSRCELCEAIAGDRHQGTLLLAERES